MKKKVKCVLLLTALVIGLGCGIRYNHLKAIEEMDRNELHYDADGWFLMVNKGKNLVGLYYATEPVMHKFCDTSKFIQNRSGLNIPTLVYGGTDQTWHEGHTEEAVNKR